MSPRPEAINADWMLDSRGIPTVTASITVGRVEVSAFVPSGKSKGKREAVELRDGGVGFFGQGVDKAVRNIIDEIWPAIRDLDILDQRLVDQTMIELDGTKNKKRLGANAMLAVSLAVAKAAAYHRNIEFYEHLADLYGGDKPFLLPTPLMNVINGGVHANNGLAFQEFMIAPVGAPTFSEGLRMGAEVYAKIGELVGHSGLGDEGGYSPVFSYPSGLARAEEALMMLMTGIEKAGYIPGEDIGIALDPAASEFYGIGLYNPGNQYVSSEEMVEFYTDMVKNYPIISIEDGMAENDQTGWRLLTDKLGDKIQIVGDDLFVTNPLIFRRGIKQRVANAILVKPNQIGTLTETLDVVNMAHSNDYNAIISHRSGETEDTTIADLAVATNAGQIKAGAPARGERTAKYNRLLRIERKLGSRAQYAGASPFKALAA